MSKQYTVQRFNIDTEQWETVIETDESLRVLSNKFAQKTVFETDDPEFNG